MNTLDKFPIIGTIRRRMRLELAQRAVINGPAGKPKLYRYKDPETGVVYVGISRWDPALTPSAINEFDGMTVETKSDTDP